MKTNQIDICHSPTQHQNGKLSVHGIKNKREGERKKDIGGVEWERGKEKKE